MRLDPPPLTTPLEGTTVPGSGGRVQTYISKSTYWGKWITQLVAYIQTATVVILEGAHADRPDPTTIPDASIYYETDRGAQYMVVYATPGDSSTAYWKYVTGVMTVTLFPDTKPADLGVNDTGFVIHAKVRYNHYFIWDGTAWYRAPGDYGQYVQHFRVVPSTPGWAAADGTSQRVSNDNGTTSVISVPNIIDATHLRAGAYSGTLINTTAPTATAVATSVAVSVAASIAVSSAVSTGAASGTIGVTFSGSTSSDGAHTHTHTPVGGISGTAYGGVSGSAVVTDHTHYVSGVSSGAYRVADSAVWGTGAVTVDDHLHTLSTLFLAGVTTGNNNQDHYHTIDYRIDTVDTTYTAKFDATGAPVIQSFTARLHTDQTDYESNSHDHDIGNIDFSSYSTDYAGALSADVVDDHFHYWGYVESAGISGGAPAIDISGLISGVDGSMLTFTGSSTNTSSNGAHTHGVGTLAGSFDAAGITVSVGTTVDTDVDTGVDTTVDTDVDVTVNADFEVQSMDFYALFRL